MLLKSDEYLRIVIADKSIHPSNDVVGIEVIRVDNAIEYKLLHPENALVPIEITLFGIYILVKLLQPEKSLSPILITSLVGMFTRIMYFLLSLLTEVILLLLYG
jgi:hypothetical protein